MCRFSLFDIGGIGGHLEYVTGYHIKQTYQPRRTSHSRVARPTLVASPETVGVNPDSHTHCETDLGVGLEFGHNPVNLSGPLQRLFEGEV